MEFKISSLFAALSAGAALQASGAVEESSATFLSDGRKVRAEVFQPTGVEKAPAILVLHGAGGMDYGNRYVRQIASAFAASGYATYLIHYFDRTGHSYAGDATIRANFASWLDAVSDAVGFVASQPRVDSKRVATFGYSLGGYLAVAHAARDPRIRAVVELAGGIDESFAKKVERMPPTLIVHGTEDRRVEPERARELERLLKKVGAEYQTEYYEGEGHVLSPMTALDALSKGLTFLDRHLR
ncbi:MAG TPA: dienelactone hydrolase family protein [Chthoniobacteraceae bacterium]|jgi:dipeptidyl aminopeptidase/acylaminoacyl peptidase